MASVTYHIFKLDLMTNDVNLSGDTINVALLTSAYTISQGHQTFNEISAGNEVVGSGYTAGGEALTSLNITSAASEAQWDAADVTWSSSTITARYAVIYSVTNNNRLICVIDFVTDKSSSNGDFTIQWNAQGIINLNDA